MLTREEIIKKVQEWSRGNNDRTPSEKNVREELGIYSFQWSLYWDRMTDLQRDAGLTPHVFDKTKFSREDYLDLFIKQIREYGKWPSKILLDRKHHTDSRFPTSGAYYTKFNKVSGLAKAVLEYVYNKKDFQDIVDICNSALKEYPVQEEPSGVGGVKVGYVYLGIQKGDYKIGHSKDPGRRREDISTMASEPFQTIHEIKTDDMEGVERYWHNRFKSKWIRGEWYKLNLSDVKAFKRWKRIF